MAPRTLLPRPVGRNTPDDDVDSAGSPLHGSGAAALIYEVVWQQLLQLVIGSSTVSLGVLLGIYMGGMCLGSLAAARLFSTRRHPLRVYAGLEAAIGVMGLVLLVAMPLVSRVYAAVGGIGPLGVFMRALIAGVCLLPPTFAMGATLPVVARWAGATPAGRAWLGLFYAGNLAGAVFGCLLAGFYLLRVYDMVVTTYVAAGLNATVALIAWAASRREDVRASTDAITPGGSLPIEARPSSTQRAAGGSVVSISPLPLSGFCALAAEVLWTRMLALTFGATVYTFSIVLAVFLVGLGLGSPAGAVLGRRLPRAEAGLGWCQIGTVACIAWSAYALATVLPF